MKLTNLLIIYICLPGTAYGQIAQFQTGPVISSNRVVQLLHAGVTPTEVTSLIAYCSGGKFRPHSHWHRRIVTSRCFRRCHQSHGSGAERGSIERAKPDRAGQSSLSPIGNFASSPAKPRIYVEDSNSWSAWRNWTGGGAKPQRAEIMKTSSQSCTVYQVTNDRGQADFFAYCSMRAEK